MIGSIVISLDKQVVLNIKNWFKNAMTTVILKLRISNSFTVNLAHNSWLTDMLKVFAIYAAINVVEPMI